MKRRNGSATYARLREQAKTSLNRIRVLTARRPSPLAGLSVDEAIRRIRAVREELWQDKVAPRR